MNKHYWLACLVFMASSIGVLPSAIEPDVMPEYRQAQIKVMN